MQTEVVARTEVVAQTEVAAQTEVVAETGLVGSAPAVVAGTEAEEASVPPTGSGRTPAATVRLAPVASG